MVDRRHRNQGCRFGSVLAATSQDGNDQDPNRGHASPGRARVDCRMRAHIGRNASSSRIRTGSLKKAARRPFDPRAMKMVEAEGIEPSSESRSRRSPTRVVRYSASRLRTQTDKVSEALSRFSLILLARANLEDQPAWMSLDPASAGSDQSSVTAS